MLLTRRETRVAQSEAKTLAGRLRTFYAVDNHYVKRDKSIKSLNTGSEGVGLLRRFQMLSQMMSESSHCCC